jgi:hypothetical protein
MAAGAGMVLDKLMSLKSNSYIALLDPGGHFNKAPMGAAVLLTDTAGFLSPLKSSTENSEDLSVSSTIGLNFGNCREPGHSGRRGRLALFFPVVVCCNLVEFLLGVHSRRVHALTCL